MQQVRELKQSLNIVALPAVRLPLLAHALNPFELILWTTVLALALYIYSRASFWIHLLNGLLLPLFVEQHTALPSNYWKTFAGLLLLRQLTLRLVALDVLHQ